jgi:hypothetical protein
MRARKYSLRILQVVLLAISATGLAFAQGWQVVSADWGRGNQRMDVTGRIQSYVSSGSTAVLVNNQTMGGDPAFGVTKDLRIRARNVNGQTREFTYREGQMFQTAVFAGSPSGTGYPGGGAYPSNGAYPGAGAYPPPVWGQGPPPRRGACFYQQPNFSGQYFCMQKGMAYPSLPSGFNDRISSIRVSGVEVAIFNDGGFRGVSGRTRRDIRDLRRWPLPTDPSRTWNDRVSSIQVQ